jgi:hypothetical protein
LRPALGDRLVRSGELLTEAGLARASDARRVVILGGSHSAFSAAWRLLEAPGSDVAITIVHRNRLRVFYPSPAAAAADGYTDFGEHDLCPRTGRVHRMGGLRGDGRELYRRIVSGRESRVRLLQQPDADEALLRESTIVVSAFGYRPRSLPIYDRDGGQILLGTTTYVDASCRVLDRAGVVVPGLWGVGLGSGFLPWGEMGGEPSFRGHSNGVWLYQNDIGALILRQIKS